MNRERYEELMDGWARGVLPEGEAHEFDAAIAANAEWRAEAEDHRRLARVMATAPKVKAPEGLLAAAMKRARSAEVKDISGGQVIDIAQENKSRRKGGRRWYMSMAAAAAFAIVGVSAYQLSGTNKTQSRGSVRSEMGDRTKESVAVADGGNAATPAPKKTSVLGSVGSTQRIIPNGLVPDSGKDKGQREKKIVGGDVVNGARPAEISQPAAAPVQERMDASVTTFSEAEAPREIAQATEPVNHTLNGAVLTPVPFSVNEDLNAAEPIVVADSATAPPVSRAVKEESALPTPGAASALDLMAMDIAVDGMGREAATSSDESEFESDQFRVHSPDHDGGNTLTIRPNAPATMPNRKVDAQSPKLKAVAKNESAKSTQAKRAESQDLASRAAGSPAQHTQESGEALAVHNQATTPDDVMKANDIVITDDETEFLLAQANSAGGRPWFGDAAGGGGAVVNGFASDSAANPSGSFFLGQERQGNLATRSMVPNGQAVSPAPGATQQRAETVNASLVQFEFPDQQSLDTFTRNLRYDSRVDGKQAVLPKSAARDSYDNAKRNSQLLQSQPSPVSGPPTPPGLADKRQVRRTRPFDADAYTSEVIRTSDGRLVLRLQKKPLK